MNHPSPQAHPRHSQSGVPFDPAERALLAMALEAGEAILAIYAAETDFSSKGDGSPVTAADHAAEAIILRRLSEHFPDLPVVAEEAIAAGHIPASGPDFILVDPLDGTREFISRNGEFTVNIAIIRGGVPVQGVVYAPASGDIYWNADGAAFHASVRDGAIAEVAPIAVRPAPAGGISILASRSHLCAQTQSMIEALNATDVVSVGSSLKLCWLASGRADVYPRLSPTMQWDIAAGHAVLRAAGGTVRNIAQGEWPELAYRLVPDTDVVTMLRNPAFVALGDPRLVDDVRKCLAGTSG
ncbi:3'(2'),5'-bisphosphate nucleotidase CysQ [Pannonibacter sp.]|uniref:3'(2'),5'-bisphosphate nucleotidase CysQ n=1 Tax=Pannonibacter sp. TaxID=1906786 RepID=UPI003F6E745B